MLTFRPHPYWWSHNRCWGKTPAVISPFGFPEAKMCFENHRERISPPLDWNKLNSDSDRFLRNKLQQNPPSKSVLGQRKNVVSQRIRLEKKTRNSGSHSHTWDAPATLRVAKRKRQEINPVWEAGNCGGQTPQVQAPLRDNFQRKLDTHKLWCYHSLQSDSFFLCISPHRVKETRSSHSPYRGPGSSSGDPTPEQTLNSGWKKSPHRGPGTCVSAWSYATLTEFHFSWQVERGIVCGCYRRKKHTSTDEGEEWDFYSLKPRPLSSPTP